MIHNPRLIVPAFTRVLIEKPKALPKVTDSGIILEIENKLVEENRQQVFREKEIEDENNLYAAVILAVGPSVTLFKAGDKVCVGKYAGFEVVKDSYIYLIDQLDIQATL